MQMQREMGVSHVVFFRSLAQLPEGWVRQTRSNGATLAYADGTIDIMLDEECERSLGLIRLPYTPVTFRYTGLSDSDREQFQARFDLTFQRGGG